MATTFTNERGFTFVTVLVAVVIIGLTLGLAGTSWRAVMQREREEELLFRGNQYRRALASYYSVRHGNAAAGMYPGKLEDLLKDPRSLQTVRHIRKLYKDPVTGGDFEPIYQGVPADQEKKEGTTVVGRIRGVKSTSGGTPFRQGYFPPEYDKFAGANSYANWEFTFEPGQQPVPGATPATGVVGTPAVPGLSPLAPAPFIPFPTALPFGLSR